MSTTAPEARMLPISRPRSSSSMVTAIISLSSPARAECN
jgi:hypothetical protein